MHEPWDENYQRGYEWWLMTEAKKVFQLLPIYTVVHKKRDTFIFSITLANIDGFSYFFHYYIQQRIAE